MKKVWVQIKQWNKEIAIAAIEGGADALVIPEGQSKLVSELGKIITIAKDGDLIPGVDVVFFTLKSAKDEDKIVELSKEKIVIVECSDWTVIPLENIIAKGGNNIIVQVRSLREAQVSLGALEKGVEGVLINAKNIVHLRKILFELSTLHEQINLSTACIESVSHVGMGDRVCVDTCTSMFPGQGMLVGNSSSFLFLMHAENIENSYVEQRPFRINAGAVHAYTRSNNFKTKYLSELSSGSSVQITDYLGYTETAVVGRVKIEKRPLLLIKAICDDCIGSTIVQNAETIRLISPDGVSKSVIELKTDDEVIVSIESAGRHFGYKIDENIDER